MTLLGARSRTDPTATPVRQKPALDFSRTGLIYIALMLFLGIAAVNSQANLLFGVFGALMGLLLISGTISRRVMSKLRVDRVVPEHAVVGRRTTLGYQLTNEKKFWPSLSVAVSELGGSEAFVKQPLAYMLHAAPKATAVIATEVIPKRRGRHVLEAFQLSTGFPFGFVRRAAVRSRQDTLLVYPAVGQMDDKVLALCRSSEGGGSSVRPRRGGADEFYGVKEFRNGENPRWIYWKRSARTGVLVSKEMTAVSPPTLLLLVDTFLEDKSAAGQRQVELCIAMAGTLATHAMSAGLLVGVLAWSGKWAGLSPSSGKRQQRELMSFLAQLPLNIEADTQELLAEAQSLIHTGTTPVLLTSRDMGQASSDMVVISPQNPLSGAWFKFDESIDFSICMPREDQGAWEKVRPREKTLSQPVS